MTESDSATLSSTGSSTVSSTQLYTGDPKRLATARGSAPLSPAARTPATCAAMGAGGERQPGRHWAGVCVPAGVRSRRRAPRQPAAATRHARARSTRHPAPSAGTPAADHAAALWQLCCRIGTTTTIACQVVDFTRALPPRANGHDRGAWCEHRNRTASARWGPRLPGQPASRLHWHAFVRAAFDNIGTDRRGLRARHADTHAQSITRGARGLKVRRSRSIGPAKAAS